MLCLTPFLMSQFHMQQILGFSLDPHPPFILKASLRQFVVQENYIMENELCEDERILYIFTGFKFLYYGSTTRLCSNYEVLTGASFFGSQRENSAGIFKFSDSWIIEGRKLCNISNVILKCFSYQEFLLRFKTSIWM